MLCCKEKLEPLDRAVANLRGHTPYANMADNSVVAWNELYQSEASWASVFCFDNASSEKSCLVGNLDCFIPQCL